jgi:hypothetical protein
MPRQHALEAAKLEAQAARLAELLANIISDTRGRVEKKQAQVRRPACRMCRCVQAVIVAAACAATSRVSLRACGPPNTGATPTQV